MLKIKVMKPRPMNIIANPTTVHFRISLALLMLLGYGPAVRNRNPAYKMNITANGMAILNIQRVMILSTSKIVSGHELSVQSGLVRLNT